MVTSLEKFSEQFNRIQEQVKGLTAFEQLYAIVELTNKFENSYRYFLVQLFQAHIQNDNDIMFNHTVDDANSSDIVNCLLSSPLDKILSTLKLFLPLITTKTINEKLLDAYRDVLIYLDKNLHPSKFSLSEQQIINYSQQICFFIQTNPYLKKLLSHIPKLIYLIQTNKFHTDEPQQQYHQPLQRHASIHSQISPLMNFASEGSPNSSIAQQLTRHETNDSGVDLTEPGMANFFSGQNSQQKKHSSVGKTASSPIPEHGTLDVPVRMPLKGVLSAPTTTTNTTMYSDYRRKLSIYQQQKHISTLAKSDEEEEESQEQLNSFNSETINTNDNFNKLGQFHSLRYRTIKNNQTTEDVSQYLGVDTNSAPVRNTFIQPKTGMKDVPKWLKYLRLHKYDVFFSQITYDEMMNLTLEQLKSFLITDGACAKILLNIKKLKERSTLLNQWIIDIDNGKIDLANLLQQLNELMMTPIRSKQLEQENNSDEDLPKLIMELLEKIYQQVISYSSTEHCYSLLSLIDRCYRIEVFTSDQIHLLLKWRRRLLNILQQSSNKTDYKPNQVTPFYSIPARRSLKQPSVRPMKSSSSTYHSNYSTNSVPLSKYNSEPQNNNNNLLDPNLIRRPNKSPTNNESSDINVQTSFNSIISSSQRNNGAYLANNQHQALTRKASIDPYGEINTTNNNNNHHHHYNKTKLCQTFSDPNRVRFHNPTQMHHMQSPNKFQQIQQQQQSLFRMISSPYSQQQRMFISRSPPMSTMETVPASPIKKCYSENEPSDYFGKRQKTSNNNDIPSLSNTNDNETIDDQRHQHTEFDSFCRQITESAISDDVNDSSMYDKDETSNVSNIESQTLNKSPDTEQ